MLMSDNKTKRNVTLTVKEEASWYREVVMKEQHKKALQELAKIEREKNLIQKQLRHSEEHAHSLASYYKDRNDKQKDSIWELNRQILTLKEEAQATERSAIQKRKDDKESVIQNLRGRISQLEDEVSILRKENKKFCKEKGLDVARNETTCQEAKDYRGQKNIDKTVQTEEVSHDKKHQNKDHHIPYCKTAHHSGDAGITCNLGMVSESGDISGFTPMVKKLIMDNRTISKELKLQLKILDDVSLKNQGLVKMLSQCQREAQMYKERDIINIERNSLLLIENKSLSERLGKVKAEMSKMKTDFAEGAISIKTTFDESMDRTLRNEERLKGEISRKNVEIDQAQRVFRRIEKKRKILMDFLTDAIIQATNLKAQNESKDKKLFSQPTSTEGETNQKGFREETILINIEDVPKINIDELSFNDLKDILRLLITSISKNRLEKTTRNFLCPTLHELGRS